MKICVLTTTRAEYGLLSRLIKKLKNDTRFEPAVVVSGTHLSVERGETYKEIENDGIDIDAKIPILLCTDDSASTSKSMGLALISFSDYFEKKRPDMLVVLGDRFETLAVCIAAFNAGIPIAHIHGGEVTYGALDDSYRHCITKLSFLHFTSTEKYRQRVIQLGEAPERVFNVGALGVENAMHETLLSKEEVCGSVGFDGKRPFAVVTFHPATNDGGDGSEQCDQLIKALDKFPGYDFIITGANADAGGGVINSMLSRYADKRNNVSFVNSLGMKRYLSALKYASAVIGNSSSGIIEAPSFGTFTVNIGSRQEGRICADSIINCEPSTAAIEYAINTAFRMKEGGGEKFIVNPYEKNNTSDRIVEVISKYKDNKPDLKKRFYDIINQEE